MAGGTPKVQARKYGTLPEAARYFGLSPKTLRRRAEEGAFPIYYAGGSWPRVDFTEVEAWLRSTSAAPTSHAERRVAQVIEREAQ